MRTACLVVFVGLAGSSGRTIADDTVDYVRDVKPILAKHCLVCHSPLRQRSGFRMDTAALLIKGGELGRAIVPGNSQESPLIHAVTGVEGMPQMPPEGKGERLSSAEIDWIRRWIDAGAIAPHETPASDPRDHWAFQPIQRPSVPDPARAQWIRNPIDAFIAVAHEREGLIPRPEAERHHLLRRVYLDLTGLPPTREEMRAFLTDSSPSAYEHVVDRLLASAPYGERWGRHWMDIWRYSDWAGWGEQVRDSQPHIWHWRDWIIESLNADRPYDEMVVDMLAADEIAPTDRDRLRATGFLVRNFKLLSREQWLQDTVEHTSKAFLGLTMNCARCHDHMTDPLDQQEYYEFRAIFEPHHVRLDRLPSISDTAVDGLPRVFDKELAAPTYFFLRGDERAPQKDIAIAPNVPALLRTYDLQVAEVRLPKEAYDPARQDFVMDDDLATSQRAADQVQQKLDELLKATPIDESAVTVARLEQAAAAARHAALSATIAVERIEARGDTVSEHWNASARDATAAQRRAAVAESRHALHLAKCEQVAASTELEQARASSGSSASTGNDSKVSKLVEKLEAAGKKLHEAEAKLTQAEVTAAQDPTPDYVKRSVNTYPTSSTGRRLALARWIVDPRNPLAARVAVNHLWSRHFQRGLVPSVFNLGISGERPIHQPLLDWLAGDLVQPQSSDGLVRPWSMKHIHRLIVTSQTYRLASTNDSANHDRDPDNRFLWRAPTRRMEAEVVRDSALYVSGQLDQALGGPELDAALGLSTNRRSVYYRHAAEKQMLFLKMFDGPNTAECYERRESVVPQQALALVNSELTLVQSRRLTRRLSESCRGDAAEFVAVAIEQVLARPARSDELELCVEFLAKQERFFEQNQSRLAESKDESVDGTKPSSEPHLRAREQLVHALLNHNDFITIR